MPYDARDHGFISLKQSLHLWRKAAYIYPSQTLLGGRPCGWVSSVLMRWRMVWLYSAWHQNRDCSVCNILISSFFLVHLSYALYWFFLLFIGWISLSEILCWSKDTMELVWAICKRWWGRMTWLWSFYILIILFPITFYLKLIDYCLISFVCTFIMPQVGFDQSGETWI